MQYIEETGTQLKIPNKRTGSGLRISREKLRKKKKIDYLVFRNIQIRKNNSIKILVKDSNYLTRRSKEKYFITIHKDTTPLLNRKNEYLLKFYGNF